MITGKSNNQEIAAFVEKNYDLIRKLELISFVIFLTGFLLYEYKVANSNIVLMAGIIATAISLFLQAFKTIEFQNLEPLNTLGSFHFITFIRKIYFASLSISSISLLWFVLEFKKGINMAIIGCGTLGVILILTFFTKIQDKSKVYDLKFYLRILLCFLFVGILGVETGFIK